MGGGFVGIGWGSDEVGVAPSRGRLVIVGGTGVGEGIRVAVRDGAAVGEDVAVKTGVEEGTDVIVAVAEFVAVVNSVASVSTVRAVSVLAAGVADPRPVFGMMKSGS